MSEEQKQPLGATKVTLPAFGLAEDILGRPPDQETASPIRREKERAERSGMMDVSTKFVTFFLGVEEYALPIVQVQEINRVAEITRVPNCPDHVRGVVNLRGRILPVIELKRRLNLGETTVTRESRIVVVEHGTKVLGLMVDRVAQVLNIYSEQMDEVPEEVVQVQRNFIKAVGKIEGRMIILLDLDGIVKGE
jgi:purine-binding chemotaxis protein CheW